MTKYYVDGSGNYMGAYDGVGVVAPVGGIEVPTPPDDARQKWNSGTSSWSPYTPDYNTIDTNTLNAALIEPGSVVRALGLVTFQEVNKLRVNAGLVAYTMAQFTAALKANMR